MPGIFRRLFPSLPLRVPGTPEGVWFPGVLSAVAAVLAVLAMAPRAWALPGAPAVPSAIPAVPDLRVDPLHVLYVGAVLVFTAALIGQFAPQRRARVRSAVIVFAMYAVAMGVQVGFEALGTGWHDRAREAGWIADLLEICAVANISAVLFFHIVLRALQFEPAVIVSELATGAAYGVAFLHVLHRAGLNLSGVIATSAVASAVLGISLAPTLGNVLGGVALQLDNSIHEGDWIQLDANTQGKVKAVRWRHTVVETRNWDTIIVPNAALLAGNITVLGKRAGSPLQRRYWVYFNVDHRYAPWEVISVVDAALRAAPIPGVAAEPAPNTVCFDLGKDVHWGYAMYGARVWVTDLARDDPTLSAVRERLYAGLQRAGIPLALPGSAVFVTHDDAEHQTRKDTREHQRRVELVRGIELFEGFTEEELTRLAHGLKHAPFSQGDVMTLQGREAHWLYILARGTAEVRVSVHGCAPETVREIHAQGFFGEMGLMTGAVRGASVVALTPCDCYLLDKATFQKFLRERPELAAMVSLVLARRKAETDAVKEGLTEEQKGARVTDNHAQLLKQVERFFGLRDAPPE